MLNRLLWIYVFPSVTVSTFPKAEGRRIDRFIVMVFSGPAGALLGKPGTLHSLPRANRHLSLGRPAGPKRCFSAGKVAGWITAGLRVSGCTPTDPVGRVCLKLTGRGWSLAR